MIIRKRLRLISLIFVLISGVCSKNYEAFCTIKSGSNFKTSKINNSSSSSNVSKNTPSQSVLHNSKINYKILSEEEIKVYNKNSYMFFKNLSKPEKRAICEYTQDNEFIINFIKGNASVDNIRGMKLDDIVENVDLVISKYQLQEDLMVFRGTDRNHYKDLNVNDEFVSKIYYSTSLIKEIAELYKEKDKNSEPVLLEILLPKGSRCFYTGEPLAGGYGAELIIARDTKYKVINIDSDTIKLEVIN